MNPIDPNEVPIKLIMTTDTLKTTFIPRWLPSWKPLLRVAGTASVTGRTIPPSSKQTSPDASRS